MMDATRSGVNAFLFAELTFIIVFFHHLCGQLPPLMPFVKFIQFIFFYQLFDPCFQLILCYSHAECPFVMRCKRDACTARRKAANAKRHTAQTLFVVCACVFVLFTGLLYHSVGFIAISFSDRLCGSVASPAWLYCAPAPTFYENGSSSSIPSGMFIKLFSSVSGCAGACWFPCYHAAALLSANSHSSTMTSVVYTLPPSLLV